MASSTFLALLCAVLVTVRGQYDTDYPGDGPYRGDVDPYSGDVGSYPYDVDPYGDSPYPGDGPVVGGAGLYPGDGPYPDGEGLYPGLDIYPTDYSGGYNIRYGNPFKDPHVRDVRKYRHGWQYGLTAEDIAFIIREKAFPANMHIVPKPHY